MIKRWPRCQPVEKDVPWLFCWLSLETCEILDDDLDVSVSILISLFGGIASPNSRRVRSVFHLWEPSRVSVIRSIQCSGMWLLKPKDKVHFSRDVCSWQSNCLFSKEIGVTVWAQCWSAQPPCYLCFSGNDLTLFFMWLEWERTFFPTWSSPLTMQGRRAPQPPLIAQESNFWETQDFFIGHLWLKDSSEALLTFP